MSQGRASRALAARSRTGTKFAYSMGWIRLLVRLFFVCTLAVPARAFLILNGSVEDRKGITAQRNVPGNFAGITGWVVT
jgi:hypothetical protein